ncbi:Cysteine/Cysteine sulfinic acid decarboxylase [subsurface metagenome]
MQKEILKRWDRVDYLFMNAAVSDFTPEKVSNIKIKKKEELEIKLKKSIDILADLKNKKKSQFIIGFSLETNNLLNEAKKKMKEKKIDLVVANDVSAIGSGSTSGFLISKGSEEQFECSKDELSWKIIEKISSKKY